jgi:hypothetical protein
MPVSCRSLSPRRSSGKLPPMARKYDRVGLGGLIAAGLLVASCRGCLETDVTFEAGSGGAPGSTSTGMPLGSSGSGSNPAPSSASADTSSGAQSVSTGAGPTGSSSASSSSASSSSGGPACPIDDSFTTPDLSSCWTPLYEERLDQFGVDEIAEAYFAAPLPDTGWWQTGAEGVEDVSWFLHQRVTGPFVVSVRVQLEASAGAYQMAGLLLRDGTLGEGDPESWLKWEIGRRGPSGEGGAGGSPAVDFGSIAAANVDGAAATWLAGGHAINGPFMGRLGICRNGDDYFLHYRDDADGEWSPAHAVSAPLTGGVSIPSFAGDVQVGLIANAYDDVEEIDTVARFNDFVISDVAVTDAFLCRQELIRQTPGSPR